MSIKKPMLAVKMEDHEQIKYPVLASPKLDGIRCLVHPELGPVSRKFKPIPNLYIRRLLNHPEYSGFDGELVTFNDDRSIRTFNEIQGDVMRKDGEPKFALLVFDDFTNAGMWFDQRLARAKARVALLGDEFIMVEHRLCYSPRELLEYDNENVDGGYEGTMTRDPRSPYKEGRSTLRQGWLLKLKRFADAEGEIIGFEERMRNENVQTKDALGHSERSSHKAGLVPTNTLGSLVLHTDWGTLNVGTGYDDALRQHIWESRDSYLGSLVTFTYQPSGMQDKPRFPVFKGFRHEDDM